jgi:NADPH:quinone reductase-like Zn-dependent oxidoreductase
MMALRAHARGGPEQLVYEAVPRPRPAAGEVLVAVRAAGITFSELGWDLPTPAIVSHEVSGTVAEVGPGVEWPRVGDDVFGLVDFDRDGAAADFVAVPAAALAAKPATATHAEVATLPVSALSAWQALADHAGVAPGETVLVLGAGGVVGGYAVQLAEYLGARVVADFEPSDVVIDTLGGDALARAYGVLRPGGRVVTLVAPTGDGRAEFFIVRPDRAELERLAALVDDGRLRPAVAATFPLADGREAYTARQPRPGKTVLVV